MDIFADDQTNTNQKELTRRAIAEAGGAIIGSAAATEKDKRERLERAESSASLQAQLTALQQCLQDPEYLALYSRVSDKLENTQSELDQAILENAEEIERLEANAARTDQGQFIFRKDDGSFVYADGTVVPGSALPTLSSLPDNPTSWLAFRNAKEREAELARIQTQVLDPIRGRLQDQDDPPSTDELHGMDDQLDRSIVEITNTNTITEQPKFDVNQSPQNDVLGLGITIEPAPG